jgi:hypothetical protein
VDGAGWHRARALGAKLLTFSPRRHGADFTFWVAAGSIDPKQYFNAYGFYLLSF